MRRRRNVWLTAWLVLMTAGNAYVVAVQVTAYGFIVSDFLHSIRIFDFADWHLLLGILNVVCFVALLRWRKWGFWGICASAFASLTLNIVTDPDKLLPRAWILPLVWDTASVGLLYLMLNVGKENKTWPRLE